MACCRTAWSPDQRGRLHWMQYIGNRVVDREERSPVYESSYFEPGINLHPVGGGLGLLLRLREIALGAQHRDPLYYVLAVCGALARQTGAASKGCGSRQQREYEYCRADSHPVQRAAFQPISSMRARYLGPNADLSGGRGSPPHNSASCCSWRGRSSPRTRPGIGRASCIDAGIDGKVRPIRNRDLRCAPPAAATR